jgi:asparagine synthase (glutamine-hydrolysing)
VCGIAGIAGHDIAEPARVASMLAALQHRGPDDEGVAMFDDASLGVRRLSIIDLARGHQPMANEDTSIFAVQNGELYNFLELREELKRRGHVFTTESDTEVLPHAYEEFGDDFLSRLRGMFAVAIWDTRRRRLVLARDRFGKKPLVYAQIGRSIAFASEIQALLKLPIARDIDPSAIREYLQLGYIQAPRTGFAAIRKVRPGHALVFEDGAVRGERPYWQLSLAPKLDLTEDEAISEVRRTLEESVRLRMLSDVPLGAFLSGGLDSSSVVAFMAANSETPIKTFSIGFADRSFDELRYARLVAQRFATDHHEFTVEPSALEVLPMLVRHLGEPFADSSIVPSYYVARTARQHVTVALNGDGGDEVFGGYDRYRAAQAAGTFAQLPRPFRSLIALASRRLPRAAWTPSVVRRARRLGAVVDLPSDQRYLSFIAYFADTEEIVGERLAMTAAPRLDLSGDGEGSELERLMLFDVRTNLPGDLLVKMDIATMAVSLEARSPFLDHKLAELVAHLPTRLKFRGLGSKSLLRRAMRGTLPDEVLDRSKMGFGVPVGRWMRGPLRPLLEDTLLASPDRGLVKRDVVRRLVGEHVAGTADHGYRLWALLMLELWLQHVVNGPAADQDSRIDATVMS